MPVLPVVASTIVVRPGSIRPSRLGRLDHRDADAVLDAAAGLYASSLPNSSAPQSGATRVEPDHRRVADEVGEVVRGCPRGRVTLIPRPRRTAQADSQNAMKGNADVVVLWVWVLTPKVMRPRPGRFGVLISVSWKT